MPDRGARMARPGPYSRPSVLRKIDARSVEGRIVARVRGALIEQLGGKATASERMLVDNIATLELLIELTKVRLLTGDSTDLELQRHIAFLIGSQLRVLTAIGVDRAQLPQPSLAEYLAERGEGLKLVGAS